MSTSAPPRTPFRRLAAAALTAALALGGAALPAQAADEEIAYRLDARLDLQGSAIRTVVPFTASGDSGVIVARTAAGGSHVSVHDSATLTERSGYTVDGQGGAVVAADVSGSTGNHIVLRSGAIEVRDAEDGEVIGSAALASNAAGGPLVLHDGSIWFSADYGRYVRFDERDLIAGDASATASLAIQPWRAVIAPATGDLVVVDESQQNLLSYDSASGAPIAENVDLRSGAGEWSLVTDVQIVGDELYVAVEDDSVSSFAPVDPTTLELRSPLLSSGGWAYLGVFPGIEGTVTTTAIDFATSGLSLTARDATTFEARSSATPTTASLRSATTMLGVYDATSQRILLLTDSVVLAYSATTDFVEEIPGETIDYGEAIVGKAAQGGSFSWGIKESWRQYHETGHASTTSTRTIADGLVENEDGTLTWPGTAEASGVYDLETGEFRAVYGGSVRYSAYYGTLDATFAQPSVVIRRTDGGLEGTVSMSSGTATDVPLAELDLDDVTPTTTAGLDGLITVTYTDVPATYLAETGKHFFLSFYEDRVALDPLSFSFTVSDADARWVPEGATDPGAGEPEPPVTEAPVDPEPPVVVEPAEGVTLEWSGSAELQAAPPFGGSNYFTAGVSDGAEASYRTAEGNVAIVRDIGGDRSTPSYATRGEHVGRGSQIAVISEGVLTEHESGGLSVAWDGSFSINFYGGLVPFTLSDPVLEIAADGTGELVADLSGYASDMADPTVKVPTEPRSDVTVATFSGVDLEAADGYTITPHYAGVEVSTAASPSAAPQNRTGSGWGSWPQEFVDYQLGTGLSSYWYSSGGAADSRKAPHPFAVALNGNGPGAEVPVAPQPTPIAPPVVQAPPVQQPAPASAPAPAPQAAPAALPVAAEAPRTLPADTQGLLAELEAGTIALATAEEAGIDGELEAGSTVDLDLPWAGEDTGGTVWAYSTPVEAGTFAVAEGRATGAADLSGLEPGEHHLVLSGDAGTVVAVPITIAEAEAAVVLAAEPRQDVAAEATPISAPVASDPLWLVAAGLGGALLVVLLVGILLATGVLRLAPAKRAVGA